MLCQICSSAKAAIRRPKNGRSVCKECFLRAFEEEVHETISKFKLFKPGETIAVGVSGGKDSSVVLHVLVTLNARFDYGVRLVMVAIDEGITGYRDHSLEAVHEQQKKYGLPLKILSYDQLFGWTMDRVVERIGKRGNCTYCGVFRRQSLERGAYLLSADKLATGHNADDAAETILMNLLRGDIARLQRCTHPFSGSEGELPRVKPLYHSYEKEIVLYARYRNLQYFATECLYAPNAYRGHARTFIKQLERLRPRSITDILISGQLLADSCRNLRHSANFNWPSRSVCVRCGSISSKALCYACSLLDLLNGVNLRNNVELFKISADLDKRRTETVPIEEIKSVEKDTKKSCACKS